MKYRTLIVDDEPLARRRLRRFLSTVKDFQVIGEVGDGRAAVSGMRELRPDLVFLDVQMPELNGFEALAQIPLTDRPVVIFVTAFDQFALEAFESRALDYVLKPVGEDRVQQALERARIHLRGTQNADLQTRMANFLDSVRVHAPKGNRILVKANGRMILLKPSEIDWIEAEGDYVKLHIGVERHLVRATMAEMEKRFQPEGFIRIHRSRLVNVDHIRELRPVFQGESVVIMKTGEKLAGNRNCLKAIQERLAV
jgi:two-component system, LytTR family, response regulator